MRGIITVSALSALVVLCLCSTGCNKKHPTEPALPAMTATMTVTAVYSATATATGTPAATATATMTVTATNTPYIMIYGEVRGTKTARYAKLILQYDSANYGGATVTLDDMDDAAPGQQLVWNDTFYSLYPVNVYNYGHILRMTVYSKGVTYTAAVEAVGDSAMTKDYVSLTVSFNHPGLPENSSITLMNTTGVMFNYSVPSGEVCVSPVAIPTWTYEPSGDYLLDCEQGTGIYQTAFGAGVDGTFMCYDRESFNFTTP